MNIVNLNKGWTWTELQKISEIILGQSPPSTTYNREKKGLPFYQGKLEFGEVYPSPRVWCSSPKKIAEKGDILISVRAPVGPTNICPQKSCIGRGLAAIRPLGGIDSFFILYLLRNFEDIVAGKSTGTTFGAITGDKLKTFEIPLPPLNEQKLIVSKLEELFTKLDAGIEYLKKTQILLKQYRQSILKFAFEGKLTKEWRDEHNSKTNRESNNTEEIKVTVNDSNFVFIKNVLDSIPSWIFTTVAKISEKIHYGYTASSTKKPIGPKFLRITDIQNDSVNWNSVPYCSIKETELDKYLLERGDLIFARTGATVGKSYLIEENIPQSVFASYLIRIKLKNIIDRKFLYAFFHSYLYWNQIHQNKIGIGQPNVNGNTLSKLVLPFPPLDEQKVIVNELEKKFSLISNIEKLLIINEKYILNLRRSILKMAFEGNLVSQDPNDVPAEILLEEIKRERESMVPIKKEKSKIVKKKSIDNDSKQMRLM